MAAHDAKRKQRKDQKTEKIGTAFMQREKQKERTRGRCHCCGRPDERFNNCAIAKTQDIPRDQWCDRTNKEWYKEFKYARIGTTFAQADGSSGGSDRAPSTIASGFSGSEFKSTDDQRTM